MRMPLEHNGELQGRLLVSLEKLAAYEQIRRKGFWESSYIPSSNLDSVNSEKVRTPPNV